LRDGQLQQFAKPQELYLNPGNLFAARFFGPDGLNVIPVDIVSDQEGSSAQAAEAIFPLARTPRKIDNVLLGFRPSAVRLTKGSGVWRIKEKRDLGWTTVLRLVCGKHEINCEAPANSDLESGNSVELQLDSGQVYLFDRLTGERFL
jgi:ABC-type sugar transport system ATPase subunit